MYRIGDKSQNITHVNFLFDDVGIGDCIAALPALKYIHDFHPHIIAHVWIPDFLLELAIRSLPVSKNLIIRPLSKAVNKFDQKLVGRSFKLFNFISLATHPTDTAYFNFINRQVANSHKNYLQLDTSDQDLTKFSLPEKYVAVTIAYTTEVRQFLPEHVNKVCAFIKERGYTPVFLGKEETSNGFNFKIEGKIDEKIDFSQGINLLNITTLLESREIIKNAKAIVGLDNGLIHLAGTTDVPIIAGYTTVEPNVRMPYRSDILGYNCFSVVPPQSLTCRFCQSNMNLTLGHDFRYCYYGDTKCTKELDASLYIEKLKEIL